MNKISPNNIRIGLIGIIACAISVFLSTWYISANSSAWYVKDGSLYIADFDSYYISADIAVNDDPNKVYDLKLQEKYHNKIAQTNIDKLLPYNYPPYSLAFFAPLTKFPMEQAYHIWQWVNGFCTLLLFAILYYSNILRSPLFLIAAATITVSSNAWTHSIANGQPMMVATLGLLAGYLLSKKESYTLASIVTIFTIFKPQMAIIPMLYLLIVHGSKFLKPAIITSVLIAFICSAIFGIDIWFIYLDSLLHVPYTLHQFEPSHLLMGNVRAILLFLFGEANFSLINHISLALWLLSLITTCLIAASARKGDRKKQDLGFSLAIVLGCVFSPYLFVLSLTMLIIPIAYLLKYSGEFAIYIVAIASILLNFISSTHPELNPFTWVVAQFCLIGWILHLLKRNKQYA